MSYVYVQVYISYILIGIIEVCWWPENLCALYFIRPCVLFLNGVIMLSTFLNVLFFQKNGKGVTSLQISKFLHFWLAVIYIFL